MPIGRRLKRVGLFSQFGREIGGQSREDAEGAEPPHEIAQEKIREKRHRALFLAVSFRAQRPAHAVLLHEIKMKSKDNGHDSRQDRHMDAVKRVSVAPVTSSPPRISRRRKGPITGTTPGISVPTRVAK
jgi:hypothetical protein